MSFSDDLQFEDDQEQIHKSKATGFTSTLSVKLDSSTGTLVGWESLFKMLGKDIQNDLPVDTKVVVERLKRPIYHIE